MNPHWDPHGSPPEPPGTALTVTGVTKTFGAVTAVDDVSLSVPVREVVALLGPNGAGKTTLLDMVLGFTTPDTGTIEVLGRTPAAATRRGAVGAMLQTGGLLKDLTVEETLRMLAVCHRDPLPVEEVIGRADIGDFVGRKVGACSGGQVQRLRFGLALLPDPELLILDEPTAGMDATARREFWRTMHAEAGRGRTIVFATHYLGEADDFADRLILIRDGSIVVDGTLDELVRDGDKTISGTWISGESPTEVAAALGLGADAVTVDEDRRVTFSARDGDGVALHLLRRTGQRHAHPVRRRPRHDPGGGGMTEPGSPAPIRVLIADDQELVRAGLAALLNLEPDLEVVAQLPDGANAARSAEEHHADVAVLDIGMPYDGIRATADVTARGRCRVLVVTTFGRAGYLQRAMAAGASGFLVKDAPAEQLAAAIRAIHAGNRIVVPTIAAAALAAGPNPLTAREAEVLGAAGDGSTVRDIAARLHLATGTVRNHLSSAIAKTGAANRVEANRTAEANGWL